MVIKRRKTRQVRIGAVKIGGNAPVSIQSMAKTDTADVDATVRQIKALEREGCEIIRVAVKDMFSARALSKIKAGINIPLVADIHFHFQLALEAIARGVDGLRLNPGNIYRYRELKQVVKAARKRKIPIRVGVNSGSVREPESRRAGESKSQADWMIKSALDYIRILEGLDFYNIIVSLKSSDVMVTVDSYRKMAGLCNYPFHLGVTAAGLPEQARIKSAIGIGGLLLRGIGDTVRVSLTGNPREEVKTARQILQSLGARYFEPEIIACPTCGRTQVDVVKIAQEVKKRLNNRQCSLNGKKPLRVAIMGCMVNGPGEARDADIGLAAGKKSGAVFIKGKRIRRVREEEMVDELLKEINRIVI
ncbi:MAG: flavodoxin-dependent (E)-4-hydroxy-3-methylbut-2-enyl-diphosphate synthase [Candidatus Omnitrophota bacterium]|nr:flavodoxin-dependent (E)-4-hydroxy-3-methylbut-2-enyl-diphosphate synthase [Candidatus Omnitrophota bacterium]